MKYDCARLLFTTEDTEGTEFKLIFSMFSVSSVVTASAVRDS
jgi:hypothetical protein